MSEGALVSIILGILSLIGVVVVAKLNKSRPKAEVTQEQFDKLNLKIEKLEAHRRITDDYIFQLRQAVEVAGGDVPPWPKELTSP